MRQAGLSAEFKNYQWGQLMLSIAKGAVVPVIGPELLSVEVEGREVNLYRYVAERLAAELDMEAPLSADDDLGDVVTHYMARQGSMRADVYYIVWSILRDLKCAAPKPLRQLAEIEGFHLFISTTFDSLMHDVLREVRQEGAEAPLELSFRKDGRMDDLPADFADGPPAVYHVFGKASNTLAYVTTEEELLDFGCLWQDTDRRPKRLASHLRDKYLMVLGCSFQNWLSRFFLYALKGDTLFARDDREGGGRRQVLADDQTRHDAELTLFLSRCHGHVYNAGGALEFIDELSQRWRDFRGQYDRDKERESRSPAGVSVSEFAKGSVFISYASEDAEAARAIQRQLETAGLDVWLDKKKLESGEDYKRIIFNNIENSSIFIPIVSRNVLKLDNYERFFRMEWDRAIQSAVMRTPIYPFIQPVVIDDTKPHPHIRAEIVDCHWEPAEAGELSDHFIKRCRECVRQLRRSEEIAR